MSKAFENKKDNPRHIGMLGLTAYPILGPSDYPSRVIFHNYYTRNPENHKHNI